MKKFITLFAFLLLPLLAPKGRTQILCDGSGYKIVSSNGSPIYKLDFSGATPVTTIEGNVSPHNNYNSVALGYNVQDGFLYAYDNPLGVYKFDYTSGAIPVPISGGLPNGNYNVMTINLDGIMFVGSCNTNTLHRVDLNTQTYLGAVTTAVPVGNCDIGSHPITGNIYHYQGTDIFVTDPDTGALLGTYTLPVDYSTQGSTFFDAEGNFYLWDNNDNRLRRVIFTGLLATVEDLGNTGVGGGGDGAACSGNIEFTKAVSPDQVFPGDVVTYTFNVKNSTRGNINFNFFDQMPDGFTILTTPVVTGDITATTPISTVDNSSGTGTATITDITMVARRDAIIPEATWSFDVQVPITEFPGEFANIAELDGLPEGFGINVSSTNPDGSNPTDAQIVAPKLGVAKQSGTPTFNGDGTWDIPFTIKVENFGTGDAFDVQLQDDLTDFGTYTANAVPAEGEYTVIAANTNITVNNTADPLDISFTFTGTAPTIDLIRTAGGGSVPVGETVEVVYTVRMHPPVTGGTDAFLNSAFSTSDFRRDGVPDAYISDTSVAGNNPDPDGDDDPLNDASPTTTFIEQVAQIGAAKNDVSTVDNGDGTFTVNYSVVLDNIGNLVLYDVQVFDDLASKFGAYTPTGTLAPGSYRLNTAPTVNVQNDANIPGDAQLTVNPAFTGAGGGATKSLLQLTAGDSLGVEDMVEITFAVDFMPDMNNAALTYANQVNATGDISENGVLDGDTIDLSDDGTNVDSDGDGNPSEAGEDDATVLDFAQPALGSAKDFTGPTVNGDGTFSVSFTILLENSGNLPLFDMQVEDSLAGFGVVGAAPNAAGTYSISQAPSVVITEDNGTTGDSSLTPNAGFNGQGIIDLLTLTPGDSLGVGDKATVTFELTFAPDLNNIALDYANQATALGDISERGSTDGGVSDTTINGDDPDPDGDGDPTNDSSPTVVPFATSPTVGAAKDVKSLTDNGDGTFSADFTIYVENLGDIPMYDVQVIDNLTSNFGLFQAGATSPGSYEIVTAPNVSISADNNVLSDSALTVNPSFDGFLDQNLVNFNTGDSIGVGDVAAINFRIRFRPNLSNSSLKYQNQATVTADATEDGDTDNDTTDLSDGGTDPDPDGDGNPNETDENDPITVPFIDAVIGAALEVNGGTPTSVLDEGDGTFSVSYTVLLENFGSVPLSDIAAQVDLTPAFGANTAGPLINPGEYMVTVGPVVTTSTDNAPTGDTGLSDNFTDFDGEGNIDLLELNGGDTLGADDIVAITFTVRFRPDFTTSLTYTIQADVSADAIEDGVVNNDTVDLSDNGNVVDTNANDVPNEVGENDPTPVTFGQPVIGSSKLVDGIVDNGDGTVNTTFEVYVENLGNITLYDILVSDTLTGGFGPHQPGALTPGSYEIASAPVLSTINDAFPFGDTQLATNPNFDGDTDLDIFDMTAISPTIGVGDLMRATFTIRFFPDLTNTALNYSNQAFVSGDALPDGTADGDTTDLSDNEFPSDPDGDGNPNEPGENDSTLVEFINPVLGAAKDISLTNNGDGTFTANYTILAFNSGNIDLFDVQVQDSLTAFGTLGTAPLGFGEYSISTPPAVAIVSDGTVLGDSNLVANSGFDGAGDINLLTVGSLTDKIGVSDAAEITFAINFRPNLNDASLTYENSAITLGDFFPNGVTDVQVSDTSDSGTDPDRNGNNDVTDDSDPTQAQPFADPEIASAKAAIVTDNGDGTFDLTFNILLENSGNVTLYDVQAQDFVSAGFGFHTTGIMPPGSYTMQGTPVVTITADNNLVGDSTLTANTAFEGMLNRDLLTLNTGDALGVGDQANISFTIKFLPDLSPSSTQTFENQANVFGDQTENGASDGDAVDSTTEGSDTDPNGDGDPTNDSSPTTITFGTPEVGSAKSAGAAIDNGDGTFTVPFTVHVENTGSVPLYDIQITDNLTTGFGALQPAGVLNPGSYRIAAAPTFAVGADNNFLGNTTLTPNAAFDGAANQTLLVLTAGDSVGVGDVADVTFGVNFRPDFTSGLSYTNVADVTADETQDGVADGEVSDTTTEGNNTDPDGDGDPTNDTSPTTVPFGTNPQLGVAKDVSITNNGDGSFVANFDLLVQNSGNVTLYDISMTDVLSTGFGTFVASAPAAGEYTLQTPPVMTLISDTNVLGDTTVNLVPTYDGDANIFLFQPVAGETVGVGDSFGISLSVLFVPDVANTALDYGNDATMAGDLTEDGTSDGNAMDDSMSGDNPDADNDGDPTNDSSRTVPDLPLGVVMGVAKDVQVTGRDLTMTFVFDNLGLLPITNISAPDNLDLVFGAGNYTLNSITSSAAGFENTAFNGSTDVELVDPSFTLAVGTSETITVNMTLDILSDQGRGFGVYQNQVEASYEDTTGTFSETDESNSGTNPDPDGDDDPTNNDEATPILLGNLTATKSLGYVRSTGTVNQFEAEFLFDVINDGGAVMDNIMLTDDYLGMNPAITSVDNVSGSIVVNEVTATNVFGATTFNRAFTTNGTANAFTGTPAVLDAGESISLTVHVQFTIDPAIEASNTIVNSATVQGTDPNGGSISDTTDSDNDPNNGDTALSVPIDPSGIYYDSLSGAPIAGVTVELWLGGSPLPAVCLATGQQGQTTLANGEYRFDIIVGNDPACPPTETEYTLVTTGVPSGYNLPTSVFIADLPGVYQATGCPSPATSNGANCEIGQSVPTGLTVSGDDKDYFYGFLIETGDPQVVLNHIPLDPDDIGLLNLTKKANATGGSVGDVIVWTIEGVNTQAFTVPAISLTDAIPVGLSYVPGTATINGVATEPLDITGQAHTWELPAVPSGETVTLKIPTLVNAAAGLGTITNSVSGAVSGTEVTGIATATVEIRPEPLFDCSDITGRVFEDTNYNMVPDQGEMGLPRVRLYTVRGLEVTTDIDGRFHITCAAIPNASRGSNFAVKVDERSLPDGFKITTENPRVARLTRGKNTDMVFGAASHETTINLIFKDLTFVENDLHNTQMVDDFIIEKLTVHQGPNPAVRIIYYPDAPVALPLMKDRLNVLKARTLNIADALYDGAPVSIEFEAVMD